MIDPNTGRRVAAPDEPLRLAAGTALTVTREHLLLLYMVSPDEITELITDSPWVRQFRADHHRAGVNLASLALAGPSGGMRDMVRRANYPRPHALLDLIGDTSVSEPDANRDFRFDIAGQDGQRQYLRLDELPLPPGTPHQRK